MDRLRAIAAVLDQQAQGAAWRPKIRMTTSLADALQGADMVFPAIRVGGLDGRSLDERVPLRHGLIGQETVGPGGICYALRTVPVAMEIAEGRSPSTRRTPGSSTSPTPPGSSPRRCRLSWATA